MTHSDLCARALRWLSGTRQCDPVFSNLASCDEIPDAIGWSSCHKWRGSTVIECKTSVSDFYADKRKRYAWKSEFGGLCPGIRMSQKEAEATGRERIDLPIMGDYRFFLSLPEVILPGMVFKHAPGHGLLWIDGARIKVIQPAPLRENVNYPAEIRYLRFAIINRKRSYVGGDAAKGENP